MAATVCTYSASAFSFCVMYAAVDGSGACSDGLNGRITFSNLALLRTETDSTNRGVLEGWGGAGGGLCQIYYMLFSIACINDEVCRVRDIVSLAQCNFACVIKPSPKQGVWE